jgi:protein-S-isoprenylcysteine O-methyltransferase Ste14
MNTIKSPDDERADRSMLPRWAALIIALIFWVILLPLVHAGIPWALSRLAPHYGWTAGQPGTWNLLGLIPIALATILLIWLMMLHFSQIPRRVKLEGTPTYLLTQGPYRFTRNPMYIAELALWLGWAILYGSIPILIALLVMGPLMNKRVVAREERDLEARFGEAYLEYKNKVPRWFGRIGR